MPITFPSLATTKQTIAGYFQTSLSGWLLTSKSVFGKVKAAVTLTVYSFLATARQIDRDAVPTELTSTEGLDEWAENGTGISDGAGGYGRKKAGAATGGVGTFTGTAGTVYPLGSTLTGPDGVTKFELQAAVTVPIGGSVDGNINATTAGAAGNLEIGTVLTVDSVPVGGSSSVTLTTATEGGYDVESNGDVLQRIQNDIRHPPKAITPSDLRNAAEGIAGCSRAYVYPVRNGTGSWDIVIVQAGSGTSRDPGDPATSTTVAGKVQDALVSSTSLTVEGARTLRPTFAATGLRLLVRCTTSLDKFDFDWDSSSGGPWTIDTIVDSTHLKLSTLAPTDLKASIDAGNKPRIQVRTTGVVLPVEHRCTGWADAGGKTTLTLETALTASNTPTVGDPVYAGGPVVATVAQELLDYVDGLGPSRYSGYADPDDVWEDTVRIDQLRRVTLDATDTDGTRMVIAMPAAPTINGSATDAQAADNTADPPEILYARSISVTP